MSRHPFISRDLYKSKTQSLCIKAYNGNKIALNATREIRGWSGRFEHRGFHLTPNQALRMADAYLTNKKLEWVVIAQNGQWWCQISLENKLLKLGNSHCGKVGLRGYIPDPFEFILPSAKVRLVTGILAMWAGSTMIDSRKVKSTETELKLTEKVMAR